MHMMRYSEAIKPKVAGVSGLGNLEIKKLGSPSQMVKVLGRKKETLEEDYNV